jgi:hypothetical protein
MSLMRTTLAALGSLLVTSAALAEDTESREPVTKFTGAPPFGDIGDQERIIEHQLDTGESRVLRHSDRPLEQEQLKRDLGASEQRLRTFKTEHPNASSTPLFERQLDRLSRPARVREPSGPTLLDPR